MEAIERPIPAAESLDTKGDNHTTHPSYPSGRIDKRSLVLA